MDAFIVEKKPRAVPAPRPKSAPASAAAARNLRSPPATVAPAPPPAVADLTRDQVDDELRLFDLDTRHGPFVGITRLARWERAAALGTRPPPRVAEMLALDDRFCGVREGGKLW